MSPLKVALASLALLLVAGCSTSPDAQLVGVWTPDPTKTQLPETIEAFGRKDEVKALISSSTLKLKADHTFTLSSLQPLEGAWSLQEGTVTLRPKESASGPKLPEMVREIRATVGSDRKTLTLEQETPLGKAILVLLKSG